MSDDSVIVNQLCEELGCKPEYLVGQVKGLKKQILRQEDLIAQRDLKIADKELKKAPDVQGSVKQAVGSIAKAVGAQSMMSGRMRRIMGTEQDD